VQPYEQPVERDESGLKRENVVEPRHQDGLASLAWTAPVGLESAVVLPDQIADVVLGHAVLVGEGVKLFNEALAVARHRARWPTSN